MSLLLEVDPWDFLSPLVAVFFVALERDERVLEQEEERVNAPPAPEVLVEACTAAASKEDVSVGGGGGGG